MGARGSHSHSICACHIALDYVVMDYVVMDYVVMELFVKLDADGSGGISKDELRQGMVEPETHNSQLSRP